MGTSEMLASIRCPKKIKGNFRIFMRSMDIHFIAKLRGRKDVQGKALCFGMYERTRGGPSQGKLHKLRLRGSPGADEISFGRERPQKQGAHSRDELHGCLREWRSCLRDAR